MHRRSSCKFVWCLKIHRDGGDVESGMYVEQLDKDSMYIVLGIHTEILSFICL